MSSADGRVRIHDRQSGFQFSVEFLGSLRLAGETALDELAARNLARVNLPETVEVSLINDEAISGVHAQFMDNPEPTDVITFPYGRQGEILISVETAQRQAREFDSVLEREISLYLVHGILHLAGYEDDTPGSREEMEALQDGLLAGLPEACRLGDAEAK